LYEKESVCYGDVSGRSYGNWRGGAKIPYTNSKLFTVYGADTSDVPELVLRENITLQGYAVNTGRLVVIGNNVNTKLGKLTMLDGSRITGNTGGISGGVLVLASGTFTMEGGNIDNNKMTTIDYENWATATSGGGVYNAGTFLMNGGIITKNEAYGAEDATNWVSGSAVGGGVYSSGTFT
jgi:hypothetical protein